ncbi:MAG: transposase [Deltaproteobacteria bacterium]|nr:transposase [Deltaproteobacteria bacterium]
MAPAHARLDAVLPVRGGVSNSDIVRSYMGLLAQGKSDFDAIPCGWLPVDIDTFAMDNSCTAKECVGRTYAGVDGYCPLASYIGAHGFCLELKLRPSTQHSAKDTHDNLRRVIPLAQRLNAAEPKAPLLTRPDSGFDSAGLMSCIEALNAPGLPQAKGHHAAVRNELRPSANITMGPSSSQQ